MPEPLQSVSAHPSVQPPLQRQQLHEAISRFKQANVLVVGDVAIDEMLYGDVDRLSREAPVLILKHRQTDIILGAAGNAAHNLAALEAARTDLLALHGDDHSATVLKAALHRDRIDTRGLLQDPLRPTTTKTRVSGTANHSVTQQIVRLDRESRSPLPEALETQALERLQTLVPGCNGLLISDYNLGMLTPALREALLTYHQQFPVAVDSQQPLHYFANAAILTPNQPEAEKNIGRAFQNEDDLVACGWRLLQESGAQRLLITRGQDGMALFEGEHCFLIPVFNQSKVFDVTGAGDTVVATLLLAVASGASYLQAAVLGNLAASLVVRQFGAAVTSREQLHQALDDLPDELLSGLRCLKKPHQPSAQATQAASVAAGSPF
jgi:rfaE bifunctional protein kinase chain/domain